MVAAEIGEQKIYIVRIVVVLFSNAKEMYPLQIYFLTAKKVLNDYWKRQFIEFSLLIFHDMNLWN